MRRLLACALLLLLAGQVLAQQPDWVSGKSRLYPDEFYLVGVGSAQSREAAENTARASLGKIFKVQISERFTHTRTETVQRTDDEMTSTGGEEVVSTIDAGLMKTLEGTEIADVWKDEANNLYYALAVLSREKAERILKKQITDLDNGIEMLRGSIEGSHDMVQTLRHTLRAKALMETREQLNADYRIVDPASSGIAATFSLEDVRARIRQFLKNEFHLGVTAKGAESERIVQTAVKHLTAYGFNPRQVPAGGKDTAHVTISFEYQPEPETEKVDKWYYCRWLLSMNAVDRVSGSVIAGDVAQGRAGQLSVEKSKRRALYEANKAVESLVETFVMALTEG